jgi:hypothetical protein
MSRTSQNCIQYSKNRFIAINLWGTFNNDHASFGHQTLARRFAGLVSAGCPGDGLGADAVSRSDERPSAGRRCRRK